MMKALSPTGSSPRPTPGRHPFFWLATLVLLVAIFSQAKEVLIPLALAVVIAFALTPAVRNLERRLGRAAAVTLVVLVGLGGVTGFGYMLKRQLFELSTQVGKYSTQIRHKVAALRDGPSGLSGLTHTVDQVVRELDAKVSENREARPVRIVPAEATALERIQDTLEPVLKPAAKVVVVLVLVIFMLAQREDLRDRFIRLFGRRNLSLTTRTLDEAGRRISRFLLLQSSINGAFGAAAALGLLFIGVPYAPLWGFAAALLRFIPYVGTLLGVIPPTLIAFAQLDGWAPMLVTLGLFISLDLLAGYVVEPMAIGRQTGVSSMAMVVSAIWWTWLWGVTGLVLSTPLTVCLAVLGRQVPGLHFLAILLGDEPPLEADLAFYQRLLARDEDEASALLERRLRDVTAADALDDLVVRALIMAERERAREMISKSDHDRLMREVRAIIAGFAPEVSSPGTPPQGRRRILAIPTRTTADRALWEALAGLLDPGSVHVIPLGSDALASEAVAAIEEHSPDLVCITSCPPGGVAQLRYLCKRLRARSPGVRVLVLRAEDSQEPASPLALEGATRIVGSIATARAAIDQLLALTSVVPAPARAAGG
jgi:predicted PurR-regulated permease PerM